MLQPVVATLHHFTHLRVEEGKEEELKRGYEGGVQSLQSDHMTSVFICSIFICLLLTRRHFPSLDILSKIPYVCVCVRVPAYVFDGKRVELSGFISVAIWGELKYTVYDERSTGLMQLGDTQIH